MAKNKVQQYLESRIMTASKEELFLMLFDGAIRFSEQAKGKIDEGDLNAQHMLLIKAQRIMIELMSAFRKDGVPEQLYRDVLGLYHFVYVRLVRANLHRDKKLIDEALRILQMMRSTWAEAIEKSKTQMSSSPASTTAVGTAGR